MPADRLLYSSRRAGKTALIKCFMSLLEKEKKAEAVVKEEPLENPLSKEFINKHDLGASSSVNTALTMLRKKEIIIEEDGTYSIHEVLLLRWLQSL